MAAPSNPPDDDLRSALLAYTLEHHGPAFIHQHVVDTLGAQLGDAHTTPIQLTFALVGLYLHVEHGYDGRRVQRVHAALARSRPSWPALAFPDFRGAMTASDVMAAAPGLERDALIEQWPACVWAAYGAHRDTIIQFLSSHGIDP